MRTAGMAVGSLNRQGINHNDNPNGKKLAAALIIIIAVTAISLLVYFIILPPLSPEAQPVTGEFRAVEEALQEGRRMDLASPDRNSWDNGDSGVYMLVLINRYSTPQTFYMRVFLEDVVGGPDASQISAIAGDAEDWFTFQEEVRLEPGAKDAINIEMTIPDDAVEGAYSFRVLVCNDIDCDLGGNIYDQSAISLYVTG
jgi:hypothetical protein